MIYGLFRIPSNFLLFSVTACSYLSFEGYLAGQLVVQALQRSSSVTRAAWLNAIYQTGSFDVNGWLLGPFSETATVSAATVNDACNQGSRLVQLTQIQGNAVRSHITVPLLCSVSESQLLVLSLRTDHCELFVRLYGLHCAACVQRRSVSAAVC